MTTHKLIGRLLRPDPSVHGPLVIDERGVVRVCGRIVGYSNAPFLWRVYDTEEQANAAYRQQMGWYRDRLVKELEWVQEQLTEDRMIYRKELDELLVQMLALLDKETTHDPRMVWDEEGQCYREPYGDRECEEWAVEAARRLLEAVQRGTYGGCILCQN